MASARTCSFEMTSSSTATGLFWLASGALSTWSFRSPPKKERGLAEQDPNTTARRRHRLPARMCGRLRQTDHENSTPKPFLFRPSGLPGPRSPCERRDCKSFSSIAFRAIYRRTQGS